MHQSELKETEHIESNTLTSSSKNSFTMSKMTALLNMALKYISLHRLCRLRYECSNNHGLAMVPSIELASSWRCMKGVSEDCVGHTVLRPRACALWDSEFLCGSRTQSSLMLPPKQPALPCAHPIQEIHFISFKPQKISESCATMTRQVFVRSMGAECSGKLGRGVHGCRTSH